MDLAWISQAAAGADRGAPAGGVAPSAAVPSDLATLAQGIDGLTEAVAAEAAMRAATDAGGGLQLGEPEALGAEQAALDASGGTMGATHVWQ